jgi:hypothetical protein
MNETYMADHFGRVPLTIRKNVISITAASQGKGGGAGTGGDRTTYYMTNMATEVFVHESSHVFDHSTLSFTQPWYAAETKDTCVPDGYAQTSDTENFAQNMVVWTYLVVSKQTGAAKFACMASQLAYDAEQLSAATLLSEVRLK